ncbi:potassium channel family protein [Stratiformator vulcanicus]|uniref:potassium channel family protein n=1 Tax=Stratiformator vulcanicus TaxID=2527980 RepID=UPI0028780A62|nr:potassium channel protein [Stratiformator vulcanicus]
MILLLLALTAVGVLGFRIIEGARWLDCLYMTIITLTTVGYEETISLSSTGKLFVITYLVCGLGVFTYSASTLGQWIVNAQLQRVLGQRQMTRAIDELSKHFIVCGCGQMGQTMCTYLESHDREFVVVDVDEERLEEVCADRGWLYVTGDSTDDDVLVTAGIDRAVGLSTVLPTDADNVYVVLSARMLNADLQIVARATGDKAIQKLERAGATRVVSPLASGAMRMARFMVNPSVEEFLEIAEGRDSELRLIELQIDAESPFVGQRLAETDLRSRGMMVVAIRRQSGELLMPPEGSATIELHDRLFAFGTTAGVGELAGETSEA